MSITTCFRCGEAMNCAEDRVGLRVTYKHCMYSFRISKRAELVPELISFYSFKFEKMDVLLTSTSSNIINPQRHKNSGVSRIYTNKGELSHFLGGFFH